MTSLRPPSNPTPEPDPEWESNPESIAATGVRLLSSRTTRTDHLLLEPEPRAARAARTFVRLTCARWDLDSVLEPALLVVSELVTNAVRHARTRLTVGLLLRSDHLLVEVEDEDSRPLVLHHNDQDAVDGRGLILIDAMARKWGSRPRPLGKVVWAELALTP